MGFFRKADATPPFSEWQHAQVLLDAAPEFEDFKKPPKELKTHGKRVKSYFWHANLTLIEPLLRKKLKPGQVECKYGPSPDKPTVLLVNAAECPLFVIRQVPVDCNIRQGNRNLEIGEGEAAGVQRRVCLASGRTFEVRS